jgi:hypothetical protein
MMQVSMITAILFAAQLDLANQSMYLQSDSELLQRLQEQKNGLQVKKDMFKTLKEAVNPLLRLQSDVSIICQQLYAANMANRSKILSGPGTAQMESSLRAISLYSY